MELFIDSADINEIKSAYEYGILDGVTTNPSLIKKAAEKNKVKDMSDYIKQILRTAKGTPVSLEVIGITYEEIVNQALLLYKKFNSVAKNVVVKVPINPCMNSGCDKSSDSLRAIKYLSDKGVPINCTLIFTPEQALLAAKAGASYVSPFAGRIDDFIRKNANIKIDKTAYYPMEGKKVKNKELDDNGILSGVDLVDQCVEILHHYGYKTKVLAASIRNTRQFRECALVGSDVATVPLGVIKELLYHEKTVEGMKNFTKDIVFEYKKIFL